MSLWEEPWLSQAADAQREIWRGVEAQHVVATMRLVDSVEEQELLEQLLEDSKPAIPAEAKGMHYLLFTPFRYVSPSDSRFRRAYEPGAFYGADDPITVAAELAYWRWKFLMDSDKLREREVVSEHTFFLAQFSGSELDISQPPWSAQRDRWRHPDEYSACHALAQRVRRDAQIDSIRYESARREGFHCNVVFAPSALSLPKLHMQQTWTCKASAASVIWAHDRELHEFPAPEH